MKHHYNWPNLKLTYWVTMGEVDEWGHPVQSVYECRQVCKRSVQSLQTADKLCQEVIKAKFPHAETISLVDIKWLGKPLESVDPRAEDSYVQTSLLESN